VLQNFGFVAANKGSLMFDGFSAEILARVQFAFTVSFHIIFPAFSIGLASFLAVLNALWLWTNDEIYQVLFNYTAATPKSESSRGL
jgi:hypothetical protein